MTKYNQLPQAEHLYIYDRKSLGEIGSKLGLSRRILFYWKKKYNWDEKRFEMDYEKENFSKELLDFALEYMKGDPSMDMFLSGARGSIGNNFKNMFVMKGVITIGRELGSGGRTIGKAVAEKLGLEYSYFGMKPLKRGFKKAKKMLN